MKNNLKLLLILALYSSCKLDVAVPTEIELEEIKSFYLGLYDVDVYQIQDERTPILKDLAGFPTERFNDYYEKSEWELLDHKSEIYNRFLIFLNSGKDVTEKNNIAWINDLIEDLKTNEDDFYIAGFYRSFPPEPYANSKHYYFYYILDKENRQLIRFSESSDPF